MDAPLRPVGLRERNKEDKLQRIKDAASAVFTARGFDDATLREIAAQAGVGLGTLFSYASNKPDLVFLLFTTPLEDVTEKAFAAVPREAPFPRQLRGIFESYYRFFDRNHVLSRILLREIFFHTEGASARRFAEHWQDFIDRLAALAGAAQALGLVAPDADPKAVGRIVFAIYQAEVRRWLSEAKPDRARGLVRLERLLKLAATGFAPKS
ncbi:MAG: TetR/AcrR family transcriptional regulator [Rhodospirillaceae bacterium]|nr:TetR/AcrR family transcriptional regulator [Rhodospirillaceae bacterium]